MLEIQAAIKGNPSQNTVHQFLINFLDDSENSKACEVYISETNLDFYTKELGKLPLDLIISNQGSSSVSYIDQYNMLMNAFRLDHKKKFCLTAWLEKSNDFLELDRSAKTISMKSNRSDFDLE